MARLTKIEWTNSTWNPTTGCSHVSSGCDHCYADILARRLQAMHNKKYRNGFQLTLHPEGLELPLTWKQPRLIFVNSMSDLYHHEVPDNYIRKVFAIMTKASWHTFQVLTKRPVRMASLNVTWPSNVWAGTTVENQDYVWRIRELIKTDAKVHFISFEPLLGSIINPDLTDIEWAIVGAESGHGARPMNLEWVRQIRDSCKKQYVAFFYKQNARNGRKVPLPKLDGKLWNQFPSLTELAPFSKSRCRTMSEHKRIVTPLD